MADLELYLSQRIIFGEKAIGRLGDLVEKGGGTRVLLVADPGVVRAGHLKTVLASLENPGASVFVFDEVGENPTTRHVKDGLEFARRHAPIDFMVALGGGSAMDCAKGINFLLTNGGRMEDYWGVSKARHPMLPAIGIPTTAGTGSEAQSFAVIARESDHRKMACGDRKALFQTVLLDPTLSRTMPRPVTAVTAMDAISHALESYVTSRHNAVSQMLAREAWRLLYRNFTTVLNHPDHLEARADMMWGAHFAGAAIENSMLGAAHACANPLTARFGVTHGIAVAIMLPHVVQFNAGVAEQLYAELLEAVGLSRRPEPATRLANTLKDLMAGAGVPQRLSECEVDGETLDELAAEATRQWTGQFNPRPLNKTDFRKLYERAY